MSRDFIASRELEWILNQFITSANVDSQVLCEKLTGVGVHLIEQGEEEGSLKKISSVERSTRDGYFEVLFEGGRLVTVGKVNVKRMVYGVPPIDTRFLDSWPTHFTVRSNGVKITLRTKSAQSVVEDLLSDAKDKDSESILIKSFFKLARDVHEQAWENVMSVDLTPFKPLANYELVGFPQARKANGENGIDKEYVIRLAQILDASIRGKRVVKSFIQANSMDEAPRKVSPLDEETYFGALVESSYFDNLFYRANLGRSLPADKYVTEMRCLVGGSTQDIASLYDFEKDHRVHLLIAPAGRGKTALLTASVYALVRRSSCLLKSELGLGESSFVPFFFSFNSPRSVGLKTPERPDEALSFVFENLQGLSGFEVESLVGLARTLGKRALIFIDAFDEADDWKHSNDVVSALLRELSEARFVIASRNVLEVVFDRKDCKVFNLVSGEGLAKGMLKAYLEADHSEEAADMDEIVNELLGNEYMKNMCDIPLFASLAARESCQSSKPGKVYERVAGSLLEKGCATLKKQGCIGCGQKEIGRFLKMAAFDALKDFGAIESASCEEFDCRDFFPRMNQYAIEEGVTTLPDEEAWRRIAISSGLIAWVPGDDGGRFAFDQNDMTLYLAAHGAAEAFKKNQVDCLNKIDGIVARLDVREARVFIVVLIEALESLEVRTPSQIGLGSSASLGYVLMLLHHFLSRASLPAVGDSFKPIVVDVLKDVKDEIYARSQIKDFAFGSVKPHSRLIDQVLSCLAE